MSIAIEMSDRKTWEEFKYEVSELKKKYPCNTEKEEVAFARSFCHSVLKFLWQKIDYKKKWACRQIKTDLSKLELYAIRLSKEIADYF